jgi:hypothetical protein
MNLHSKIKFSYDFLWHRILCCGRSHYNTNKFTLVLNTLTVTVHKPLQKQGPFNGFATDCRRWQRYKYNTIFHGMHGQWSILVYFTVRASHKILYYIFRDFEVQQCVSEYSNYITGCQFTPQTFSMQDDSLVLVTSPLLFYS